MSVDFDCHDRYRVALTHYKRILVHGPPGVGKTHNAVHSAIAAGEDFIKITCTDGDMSAEYRGMWVPAGDHFDFVLGVATAAWTELNGGKGGLLVLDEIDHAPPEVHSLLHAIMDDPDIASLTLPNKVKIKPGPKFRVVATMNGIPSDLTDALQDRFEATINITGASPEQLVILPEDLRETAEKLMVHPDPTQRVSFRKLLAFAKSRDHVGHDMAAQLCFGSRWNDILTALRLA